jgi:O-antigen/teichoic acid export membrane protein
LASNIVFVLVAGASIAWTTPSLGSTLSAFLLSLLIVAPFALFALARAARASGGDAGREPALRDLASTCGVLMLIQCITFLSTQADIWIAGLCCPHDQLALYGAARRLVLIIVMPLQMANYLVVGSIAELLAQGRRAELERLLRSVATLFAAPAVLGLIVVVAAGGPLLSLLFGDFYRAAARPLILLSAGQLVLVAAGSCHSTLLMAGQQSKALCVNGLAAASIVLGGWLAAERYGVTGLAVAYSLVVALESLALLALARRSVGVWTHVNPRVDWASLRAAGGADLGVAGPAQDDADALGNAQEREHE